MLLTGLPCSDNTLSRFSTTFGIIATMSAPPVTLKDASLRLRDASKQRYQMLRKQAAVYYTQSGPYMKESWEQYRPRTLLQWTGFAGLALLAVSALSTILNILGGLTLGMAWIGLVVYFMTVSTSTVAGFFCGSAVMMFSGTCAVMGTCILSGVAMVYGMMALATRVKGYASPYVEAIQQQRAQQLQQQGTAPTAQMRYAPQASPTRLAPSGTAAAQHTGSSASAGSQLLPDMSPGNPQVSEFVSTATTANSHSYSSPDAPHKAQPSSNSTKGVKGVGGSAGQHAGMVAGSHASHRVPAAVGTA